MKYPRAMSVREFNQWIRKPIAREASLPSFFKNGVERTRRVLKGEGNDASINKWKSFIARHYKAYEMNPTARRRIAIRNWGYALGKSKNEKNNLNIKFR